MKRRLRDERGFMAAESVLLALLFCGICLVVGGILQRAMLGAAQHLNNELAGTASPADSVQR
jgi:hypothetical protein